MSSGLSFADALGAWKDINLGELQKTLDSQGIELVESQKESVVGRKALAERTKEFKRISDEEKLNAVKGLLKAYQTEIDSLTRRCKHSENAFLSVYKALAEAPDPYPLLDLAVDQAVKISQASALEVEVAKLRQDNVDLQGKLDGMSNSDREKKKAEKRAEVLEEKMEELVKERVTNKENELKATYDERLMNYEEREKDLQRQVATAKSQLRDLRTSNDTKEAQLLDHTQRQDQESVARLSELDLIVADLERANSRVAAVERRNELLRAEVEASRSGTDSETVQKIKSLESTIESLEASHDQLSRALERQKDAAVEDKRDMRAQLENLGKDALQKDSDIDGLKKKLLRYSDYDEIKRELEIMKYVEFAGAEDDALATPNEESRQLQLPDPNGDKASESQNNSLEVLLAAKNKRIQDELTKFRIIHSELESNLAKISSDFEKSQQDLDRQKNLNERLEQDLLELHGPNGVVVDGRISPGTLGGNDDPLAALNLSQASRTGTPLGDEKLNGSPIPFAPSAETSILPIVTSQRDRFRQRNAELEEELRKQFTLIAELRSETKSLQGDNLKLYEKVRYMQSYRDDAGPSSSGLNAVVGKASANPFDGASDDLGKYRSRYEESMNPFTKFQSREANRAVQALNPIEGAVFALTRHMLGSRRARVTFIVYVATLHVLVMFTSYECLSSGRDAVTKILPT